MKKNVWTGRANSCPSPLLDFRDCSHEDFLGQKRFSREFSSCNYFSSLHISCQFAQPQKVPATIIPWEECSTVSLLVKYWGISFCFAWHLIILLDAVQHCIRRNIKYSFSTHPFSALPWEYINLYTYSINFWFLHNPACIPLDALCR